MNQWREAQLEEAGHISELAKLQWADLKRIEIFPGCRLDDPILEVPEEFLPPGVMRRPASRRRDPSLQGRLFAGVDQAIARQRDENVRRALLVLWLPHVGKRGCNGLGPSSWLTHGAVLLRAISHLVADASPDVGNIWHLFHHDRPSKFKIITSCERTRRDLEVIYQRQKQAAERGLLPDFLVSAAPPKSVRHRSIEQSHRVIISKSCGERSDQISPDPDIFISKEHFDDVFVVEIISRSTWILDNIAPQCIRCWELCESVSKTDPTLSYDQIKARRNLIVDHFNWNIGDSLNELPFSVRQRTSHQKYDMSSDWPPKNYGSLALLIGLIQALNFTLVAFCTAARHHEISGAPADADRTDNRMHSRTRKYERSVFGRERDWPLHPIAVRALELQDKLASIIRPEGQRHLWVQFRTWRETERGGPLANMTEPMVDAVDHLGLSEKCDGRPHAHRWRHTVTRLVALAVVDSMQVLLDLLGHRDFESLLHYVLSNPNLSTEVMETAAEASIILASKAIGEVIEGTAGGAAAPSIRAGLVGFAMRRGIEALGTDDIREAAEILTAKGAYWGLVRPGVICTKAPGQYGPCTKGLGSPDKGSCRANCDLRLELKLAKAQCRQQLLLQLADYSNSADQPMVIAQLEGQIRANLYRWEDVRNEMLARSEAARAIWYRNS